MTHDEAFRRAKERLEAKRGFYVHLAVYFGVCLLLAVINLATARENLWFQWPLLGWGIGIFFHGWNAFNPHPPSFTEEMIEREMERETEESFR